MENIDLSLKNFEKFLNDFDTLREKDISESDTRSKIIDRLLIDVLSWKEYDITREGHVDSGYFDYKLSLPTTNLIIEAKKQLTNLKLPLNHKTATLQSLLKGNEEVINQIRSYSVDSGIPNGIITNGRQFIIGKFVNTDGTDWRNNKCLLFNGFEDIRKRYIEFFNNLDRASVIENEGTPLIRQGKISIFYC